VAMFQTTSRRLSTSNTELNLRSTVLGRQLSEATAQVDIERQVLQGAQARRQFEDALARVESATMTAPVSGMFQRSSRWVWTSQSNVETRPGDEVRRHQLLGEIPDMNTLVVKTQIPENYFYRVEPGMQARLRFDALDGVESTGTIRSIGVVAIEREASPGGALVQSEGFSGQKVFEVVIQLDEPTEEMRPGLSVAVRILLDQTEDTLAVPTTAILRRDGKNMVRVRDEVSGRTEDREVELAGRRGDRVVVTSGLNTGDTIVLNPSRGS